MNVKNIINNENVKESTTISNAELLGIELSYSDGWWNIEPKTKKEKQIMNTKIEAENIIEPKTDTENININLEKINDSIDSIESTLISNTELIGIELSKITKGMIDIDLPLINDSITGIEVALNESISNLEDILADRLSEIDTSIDSNSDKLIHIENALFKIDDSIEKSIGTIYSGLMDIETKASEITGSINDAKDELSDIDSKLYHIDTTLETISEKLSNINVPLENIYIKLLGTQHILKEGFVNINNSLNDNTSALKDIAISLSDLSKTQIRIYSHQTGKY